MGASRRDRLSKQSSARRQCSNGSRVSPTCVSRLCVTRPLVILPAHHHIMTCAAENAASVDQSHFWDGENLNWEAHRIGWAIAGGCAVLVSRTLNCVPVSFTYHVSCNPEYLDTLVDAGHHDALGRPALSVRSLVFCGIPLTG